MALSYLTDITCRKRRGTAVITQDIALGPKHSIKPGVVYFQTSHSVLIRRAPLLGKLTQGQLQVFALRGNHTHHVHVYVLTMVASTTANRMTVKKRINSQSRNLWSSMGCRIPRRNNGGDQYKGCRWSTCYTTAC